MVRVKSDATRTGSWITAMLKRRRKSLMVAALAVTVLAVVFGMGDTSGSLEDEALLLSAQNSSRVFKNNENTDGIGSLKRQDDGDVVKPIQASVTDTEKTADPKGRVTTDAGVVVNDPALYQTVDLKGDSSSATVMGMAAGYGIPVYRQFVGSLRKSGFKGHIILGLAPSVSPTIVQFLQSRNVTTKILQYTKCSYKKSNNEKGDPFTGKQCADPYPDIKTRWSRFPLQRDWLLECQTCTGPVLTVDVRDTFFQRDPFGPGSPPITGLQVFQEHPSQRYVTVV